MKKAIYLIMALVLCLGLCACVEQTSNEPASLPEDVFVVPEDYSMVMLVSINPKIRLYLDNNGIVLAIEPVNGDAKKIIGDIEYAHTDYQKVIAEFVTVANTNGYIKNNADIEFEIIENTNHKMNEEDVLNNSSEAVKDTAQELNVSVEVTCKPLSNGKDANKDEAAKPHEHVYSDATCTEAPQCACGATEGSANGHNWTDATCTAPKTCKVCEATEGSAKEHDWTDATCTAAKTCKACSATEGSARGHDWAKATCTVPKTCKTCNATEGKARGHNYTEGKCSLCGEQQENYHVLDTGIWAADTVKDGHFYSIALNFADGFLGISYGSDVNKLDPEFRDDLLQNYKDSLILIDGVYYYAGSGDGGDITYTTDGNTVLVNCDGYIWLTLERTAGDQLTIVKSEGAGGDLAKIVLTWCAG